MKHILLLIVCLLTINSFGQEENEGTINNNKASNHEVYIFKTYEDFKNESGEYLGSFDGYSQNPFSFSIVYKTEGKKRSQSKAVNNLWGFQVGPYYFRFKGGRWFSPMYIRGIKGKVFYYEGEILLSMIRNESNTGSVGNTKNLFLYSNDLNSKFIKIKKFPKEEKGNPDFADLIPCIEKGLKRYGYNPKFNAITSCIDSFLTED